MSHFFNKKKIKEKKLVDNLLFIFFTCVICIVLLAVVSISIFYQISRNHLSQINKQLNQVASINVDYSINRTTREYLDLFISTDASDIFDAIAKNSDKTYAHQLAYTNWNANISSSLARIPYYIRSLAIIDLNDELHIWGRTIQNSTVDCLLNKIKTNEIDLSGSIQYFYAGEEKKELIAIRALNNINALKLNTIGYSFAVLDIDAIINDGYVSHIDIGNATILGYLDDELIYMFSNDVKKLNLSTNNKTNYDNIYNNKNLLSETILDNTNIRICTYQNISDTQETLAIVFICCIAIVIIGGFIISIYNRNSTKHLLARLELLTNIINSVFKDDEYRDDVIIDLEPFSNPYVDELTTVARAYKEFYDKTNQLINNDLIRKLLFQEQQFIFLQSQINPHFLYNTLDTIKVLSLDPSKSRMVGSFVTSLSSIMRYSLSKDMLSCVSEELDIIRQYMVIQRTRFANRLIFTVKIQDGCENIELPKMILQPLIENSIQYNVELKSGIAQIRLKIYTKNKNLYIAIIDSGKGLSDEIITCLKSGKYNDLPGHGLKNVLIRLENIFQERFVLKVRTKKNIYTAIRICVKDQTDFRKDN